MNIRRFLLTAIMPLFCFTVLAQTGNGPAKGNVTILFCPHCISAFR
ncbi:hypothetical protein [Proteiniphilum saccharofermentans]|nr:hypothetical protein [Proteiniphilum saccharofermentans]